MSNYRIKDLNKNEKPREKLLKHGVSFLTDEELLALIIGTGGKNISCIDIAREILKESEGFKGLVGYPIENIMRFNNVNIAKACSITAAVEIGLRIYQTKENTLTEIKNPSDAYIILKKDLSYKDKEYLYLLSLNARNKMLSKDLITIGTINETLINPRDVFKKALSKNAVSIIIAHNHPSNDATPSREDILITERILELGIELGIPLVDHLIIINDGYLSLKNEGLMNSNIIFKKKGGDINGETSLIKR
jgi:DNA repair protein RadC